MKQYMYYRKTAKASAHLTLPSTWDCKPSVSRAIGLLKKEGYVISDSDGYLKLTQSGMEAAGNIYERHIILTKMLTMIGVDEETAAADACKMEHYISEKSFNAIKEHMQKHPAKP